MSQDDRKLIAVADRADMRVTLAAELGIAGADERLIASMDDLVRDEGTDILISDDEDEHVLLKTTVEPNNPLFFLLIEGGFKAVDVQAVSNSVARTGGDAPLVAPPFDIMAGLRSLKTDPPAI
jgi:hypothetical protein